jgi:mRNA interferase MazF
MTTGDGVHKRGDVYFADLEPHAGSEQGEVRPVLIFQIDDLNKAINTVVVIPLTSRLRRANLSSAVLIPASETDLGEAGVALCHQIRAISTARLQIFNGNVSDAVMREVTAKVKYTLGML